MKTIHYFLDTETGGLKAKTHALLEVCIVKRVNGKEVARWHNYIHPLPSDKIEQAALDVNGLNPLEWKEEDALQPREAAYQINQFFEIPRRDEGKAYLVGHNVGFDARFLYAFSDKTGVRISIPYNQIDTKQLASVLLPLGLLNRKMDTIRAFLGWPSEGAHTADKDVEDVIRLFDRLSPPSLGNVDRSVIIWISRLAHQVGRLR
jgi:DNA polymerase III alpha subunit (gram-positive type)